MSNMDCTYSKWGRNLTLGKDLKEVIFLCRNSCFFFSSWVLTDGAVSLSLSHSDSSKFAHPNKSISMCIALDPLDVPIRFLHCSRMLFRHERNIHLIAFEIFLSAPFNQASFHPSFQEPVSQCLSVVTN